MFLQTIKKNQAVKPARITKMTSDLKRIESYVKVNSLKTVVTTKNIYKCISKTFKQNYAEKIKII